MERYCCKPLIRRLKKGFVVGNVPAPGNGLERCGTEGGCFRALVMSFNDLQRSAEVERGGTAGRVSSPLAPPLGGRRERGKTRPPGLLAEWQPLRRWGGVFGWSADGADEIEAALLQAEREGDAAVLAAWRADLQGRRAFVAELATACRRAEGRIRRQAERQREAEKRADGGAA